MSTAFERWRAATLAPFQVRIFAAIWIATVVSTFGSLIQGVGASWLMLSIAPSADMVALVQTSTTLPIMLLSLVAGAISDIWDRRRLMLIAQVIMLSVSAALAFVTWRGHITPWMLLTFTFVLGCGAALYGPAWQSSVGEQVPRDLVPSAVALNSLGFNISRTVGPAVGGAIVAAFGAQFAFFINAVSYVGLIVVLGSWRYAPRERVLPPESLGVAMLAGLRYARLSPTLVAIYVRATVFGMMGSAVWALMPLIAKELVRGGAITYGVLLGAFGTGAMIGALTIAHLRQRMSNETLVRVASLMFGLASIAAALSPWLAATMLALVGAGAAWVMCLSTFNTSVQVTSPRWVVGRTVAIYQMLTFGGLALGSWLWGEVAHALSLRTSLIAAGVGFLASILLGRWLHVMREENLDLESMRLGSPALEPKIDIVPQSGPVVINIEYRVAMEDRVAFAAAMQELRRVRKRDGARGWTLLHDMDDPGRWIERYHSPTWIAHLRRRLRLTRADQAVEEHVRRLHQGDGPPHVFRYLERPPTALAAIDKSEAEQLGERAARTDPLFPGNATALDKPGRE
ncbi:MAG TPA: MFS transporter [Steroidobacteraceae bacterium]|nr:MFS transporter [Steroidobacteraceae bacterium]